MNTIIRKFTLAAFALFFISLTAFAGDPTGSWKYTAQMAARSVESTLTLKWDNAQLTGSVDNRGGKVDISDATFADDQVKFTIERKIGKGPRKKTVAVHYTGKLDGDTIKGTIDSIGRDQQPVSVTWDAQRVK
jgi:hypothetical protein